MSHIFISYSHQDHAYAHRLAEALEQEGFSAWIDKRIDYGTEWPRVIEEHVDACSAFIVIMTPRSHQSTWVHNELTRASRKGKRIFPLLLEGEPWLAVEATQYVDVRDGRLPPPDFYEELTQVAPPREPYLAPPAPEVSLPIWIAKALASGDARAKLVAMNELKRLSQGTEQALAAVARVELERLRNTSPDISVRSAAQKALGEVAPAPAVAPSPVEPKPEAERRRRLPAWGWILGGVAALGVLIGLLGSGIELFPPATRATETPPAEATEGLTPTPPTNTPTPVPPTDAPTSPPRWTVTEIADHIVIDPDGKYWEKYEDDTSLPGLYLRLKDLSHVEESFGDYLILEPGGAFEIEEDGNRRHGTWQSEGNEIILNYSP